MSKSATGPDPETWVNLDAASGMPLRPEAREALLAALDHGHADPRRLHRGARNARLLLDNAREATAEAVGCRPDEVTFTGSGTEAVHRGLLGLHQGRRQSESGMAISAVEHACVMHAARWSRAPVHEIPVDATARIDLDHLAATARGGPLSVIAIQAANHEVGTRQPIAEAAAVAHGDGLPLFVDACASAGHLPMPDHWDAAALSAHKWGGPAGVGMLLVRKGSVWRPAFPVDDRADEHGIGFENIAGALAAAAALQAMEAERRDRAARQHAQIERIRAAVGQIPDAEVVGAPTDRLPHLVTFSFLYVNGEQLVQELDRANFGVDSGSACAASTVAPSHVLAAMGALTHGNVRLSVLPETTDADIDRFLTALPDIVTRLRREAGM